MDEKVAAFIRKLMTIEVKGGFESKENILKEGYKRVTAKFDDYDEATLKKLVESAVETLFQEHYALQKQWQTPTDCDRLNNVFESLESKGLIAHQNYWCCLKCGVSAVRDEMEEQPDKHGYVFYHEQALEAAIEYGDLYLVYGSPEGDYQHSLTVGKEVFQALETAGFQVSWDKNSAYPIKVSGLDWKRRRQD